MSLMGNPLALRFQLPPHLEQVAVPLTSKVRRDDAMSHAGQPRSYAQTDMSSLLNVGVPIIRPASPMIYVPLWMADSSISALWPSESTVYNVLPVFLTDTKRPGVVT